MRLVRHEKGVSGVISWVISGAISWGVSCAFSVSGGSLGAEKTQ